MGRTVMSGLFGIDRTGRRCYLQRCREAGHWTLETGDWAFPFAFFFLPYLSFLIEEIERVEEI